MKGWTYGNERGRERKGGGGEAVGGGVWGWRCSPFCGCRRDMATNTERSLGGKGVHAHAREYT